MLLLADIGNTNITIGIVQDDHLLDKVSLTTKLSRTFDEYGLSLLSLLHARSISKDQVEGLAISSVVPAVMEQFARGARKYLKKEPWIVGLTSKTGITIATGFPEQVGLDRVVNTAAAYHLYGGPCLVIDFGTATTYDLVTGAGEFVGGLISPGIKICADALFSMAAQLPEIEIKKPEQFICKDTVSCMQGGVVYGYIGQVEYIVSKMKRQLQTDVKVIATGGLSAVLKGNTDAIDIYDENLTFKGLQYLYRINLGNPTKKML